MKKIVLLVFLFTGLLSVAEGQNLDFENWTNHVEIEPAGWVDNNVYTPQTQLFCTKVAGFSGFAAHLETLNGSLVLPCYLTNTHGNYLNGEGGIKYTGTTKPTLIKGMYRYNIKPNDSAVIYVILKNSGTILTRDSFFITGTQSAFTPFSYTLSPNSVIPDSMIFVAASGVFTLAPGAPVGSYLELDNLALGDGTNIYPVPNGDFDTWNTVSIDIPNSWGTDGLVEKTTDKYSGNFAAKLTTADDGTGTITAARVGTQLEMTDPTDSITGYYKYAPSGADSGDVQIYLFDQSHTQLSQLDYSLTAAANYTYFSFPLTNTISASDVRLSFFSSKKQPKDGSVLIVDKIELKHAVSSVNDIPGTVCNVYPNPATGILYIALKDARTTAYITVTDTKGSTMCKQVSKGNAVVAVSVNVLPPGLYFSDIRQGETVMRTKFIKQ